MNEFNLQNMSKNGVNVNFELIDSTSGQYVTLPNFAKVATIYSHSH